MQDYFVKKYCNLSQIKLYLNVKEKNSFLRYICFIPVIKLYVNIFYDGGESLDKSSLPIGIVDSGVGGISVLKEIKKLLPKENYLYLSDTKNAPYGTKSIDEIRILTENAVKKLLTYPCKAVVIACNTATAAAIEMLRVKYPDVLMVGLEPALRPAARHFPGRDILVLTTEATRVTARFKRLVSEVAEKNNVVCLPTQKVVSFVEEGMTESPALVSYLKSQLYPYRRIRFSAVILGCTHFPFAKKAIEKALGYRPCFYDGAVGAAKRLRELLGGGNILNRSGRGGEVIWLERDFSGYGRKML